MKSAIKLSSLALIGKHTYMYVNDLLCQNKEPKRYENYPVYFAYDFDNIDGSGWLS